MQTCEHQIVFSVSTILLVHLGRFSLVITLGPKVKSFVDKHHIKTQVWKLEAENPEK
jgi:hypothetical protein